MLKSTKSLMSIGLMLILLITSCSLGNSSSSTPTLNKDAIFADAAVAIIAQYSQNALMKTNTLEPTLVEATLMTAITFTTTPSASPTPSPTSTQSPISTIFPRDPKAELEKTYW